MINNRVSSFINTIAYGISIFGLNIVLVTLFTGNEDVVNFSIDICRCNYYLFFFQVLFFLASIILLTINRLNLFIAIGSNLLIILFYFLDVLSKSNQLISLILLFFSAIIIALSVYNLRKPNEQIVRATKVLCIIFFSFFMFSDQINLFADINKLFIVFTIDKIIKIFILVLITNKKGIVHALLFYIIILFTCMFSITPNL